MGRSLYVAGIGASAGGLEALEQLLAHLPPTGRVAYVIAQHMAPDGHAELVARLLERRSELQVSLASDGEELVGDRVYLLPAGGDGVVCGDRLQLQAAAPDSLSRPSVDVLFDSLARQYGGSAIGIVLSGTGSDGVRGCRSIRAGGGLCLAQEPRSARHSGMPLACLEAGVASEALLPQQMGARVAGLFSLPLPEPTPAEPALGSLVRELREKTGLDFTRYKPETLTRRLNKRVADLGLASVAAYLARLAETPAEWHALGQLFLVSMSSFFRDRESFAALADAVPGTDLRIWVPGCASGEECYSLAILFEGRVSEILGTDLNEPCLEAARAGLYAESALAELEPQLRERYLVRREQLYEVRADLRQKCRFTKQDLVRGEAPQNLDLISCRNLFIYLNSDLQTELLGRFHAALRPGGVLFLGPSETLGPAGVALFRTVQAEHKIFRCRKEGVA